MKALLVIFISAFFLFSCVSRTYKDTMNGYIGRDITTEYFFQHKDYIKHNKNKYRINNGYFIYTGSYKNNKQYKEHGMSFISPFSKTKGICTTIFKVRKSDNIIVSWRSEGKKSDCVWRNYYE